MFILHFSFCILHSSNVLPHARPQAISPNTAPRTVTKYTTNCTAFCTSSVWMAGYIILFRLLNPTSKKTPLGAMFSGAEGVLPVLAIVTSRPGEQGRTSHVPARQEPIEFATFVNVALVLVPTEVMAVKHTITIRASITAYSTAVGPSSETRKRCIF